MDNPVKEIPIVVNNIFANPDKSLLEKEVKRSYIPNFEFHHFLVDVSPRPGSRERVIRLFKFFRGCFWNNRLQINEISYNEESGKMFLDVTQHLQPLLYPWLVVPVRVVVEYYFRRNDAGKYFICRQDDFIEPEELMGVIVPYLGPMAVRAAKTVAASFSEFVVSIFELTGLS
ncbi:hypothetical protein C1646_770513 [Rhizophagus diaphanus]|nr:hypothetical protein C1646_770513 [Rhizophagus diaphanus] [Rhizophagus sp. MUCL 43196]